MEEMQKYKKVSFVGDIMCEKPLLKAAKRSGNFYDFSKVFEGTKKFFEESDYVVGNLETVCAGKKAEYTKELYCFNTPDTFIDNLSTSGIDMVTVANNHCLDRGIRGIKRTIQLLEKYGLEYTGINVESKDKPWLLKKIGNTKIAFLNSTYGTNTTTNGVLLPEKEKNLIRLMRAQEDNLYQAPVSNRVCFRSVILFLPRRILSKERKMKIKRFLGMQYSQPKVDNNLDTKTMASYMDQIKDDIRKARKEADLVIYCPHMGGQFNDQPGLFSEYVMNVLAECQVDAIIGTHPHVVQKLEEKEVDGKKIPCVFSLGNYSISPSSVYVLPELKPEYSIVFHMYVKDGQIKKLSFSILKIVEEKTGMLSVFPIHELYKKSSYNEKKILERDVDFICRRFLRSQGHFEVKKEYEL